MAIYFDKDRQQFYLHTQHTSYVIELYSGHPAHIHWGPKVACAPLMDELYPFGFGSDFSATDIPGRTFNSTDKLPQEFPTFGSADMREPAFHARYTDGSAVTKFQYLSHRILPGKPALEGLPATYGTAEECETLEIVLSDPLIGVHAVLSYTVFPQRDALTRSVRIENHGTAACNIEKLASFCMDLHDHNYELVHLPGAWARERRITRTPLNYGSIVLDSKRGASSHNQNPFPALVRPDTTESYGEAMGFCLVYSGSFAADVSVEQFGSTRVQMGINGFDFSWKLEPDESFQSPEVIMVYSDRGLGEMTRRFHRIIRENLCRGIYRDSTRPVLINNWEATYFHFNEEKILDIAEKAKEIGVDLMVLDDGWFGKRNSDNCSLGDWTADRNKLPKGLEGLSGKVTALGMGFGLWFEPEMVSPDSDLYRAHPDWCIHVDGRPRTEGRHQLILDLSRPEVCDYIIGALSHILENNPITYVKWDMNRNMTEVTNPQLPHKYMLGLYRVLETVISAFPHILFEGCSGGGGRFDAGMLYYFPQIWASDDTDAVERLYIQEGTSLVYPLSTIGAHVSAVPNHQVGRTTSLTFRGHAAMMGRFGFELDLGRQSGPELEEMRQQILFYKTYEQVIHQGDLYRLVSAYGSRYAAYEIISKDQTTVMLFFFSITGSPNWMPERLCLQGLDPDAVYEELSAGKVFDGSTLMHIGIPVDARSDIRSSVRIFRKKP